MASRSYSVCTLTASASGDGLAVWPATLVSELAIAAHIRRRPILARMVLADDTARLNGRRSTGSIHRYA
jgi:hypothetical protein